MENERREKTTTSVAYLWVDAGVALNKVTDNFSFEFCTREVKEAGLLGELFNEIVPGENCLIFYRVSSITDCINVWGPDLPLKGSSGTMVV